MDINSTLKSCNTGTISSTEPEELVYDTGSQPTHNMGQMQNVIQPAQRPIYTSVPQQMQNVIQPALRPIYTSAPQQMQNVIQPAQRPIYTSVPQQMQNVIQPAQRPIYTSAPQQMQNVNSGHNNNYNSSNFNMVPVQSTQPTPPFTYNPQQAYFWDYNTSNGNTGQTPQFYYRPPFTMQQYVTQQSSPMPQKYLPWRAHTYAQLSANIPPMINSSNPHMNGHTFNQGNQNILPTSNIASIPQQVRPPSSNTLFAQQQHQRNMASNNAQKPQNAMPINPSAQVPTPQFIPGLRNGSQIELEVTNSRQKDSNPVNTTKPQLPLIVSNGKPEDQRTELGERLFPLVHEMQPDLAGKITGMLLELDNIEIVKLFESKEFLKSMVDEATSVISNSDYQKQLYGARILPVVQEMFPEKCLNITQQLLIMDSDELSSLIDSQELLKIKISEIHASINVPVQKTEDTGRNSDNLCPICFDKKRNLSFQCGHVFCKDCADKLRVCAMCNSPITNRIKLFL